MNKHTQDIHPCLCLHPRCKDIIYQKKNIRNHHFFIQQMATNGRRSSVSFRNSKSKEQKD